MGGAMAYHIAFRYKPGLAGIFTLSSFLNDDSLVYKVHLNNYSIGLNYILDLVVIFCTCSSCIYCEIM